MKVIVSAMALLGLLSVARSAPEDKKVIFLSLDQKPGEWLSDQPRDFSVNPFGKPYELPGFVIMKKAPGTHRPNSLRMLDFPGPGYHGIRGSFPWLEELH